MKLLIVEDDADQIQLYQDVIDSYSKKHKIQITPAPFDNLTDAKEALLRSEYDAAIIDLKLSSNTVNLEGLELVEEIVNNLRFPLFIVSGSIAQIDKEENFLFKKRLRDGNFQDVLGEIVEVYNTGITHILGRKGSIDQYLTKIFWEHLSTSMNIWVNDKLRNPVQKQKILERYILLHIQEYLELTTESDFEDYHPAEIYIIPPIKTKLFTGDIMREKTTQRMYIVLTPSCDLAQSKAKDILLADIESENEGLLTEKIGILKRGKADADKLAQAEKDLKALIKNSYSNKYHFLPKYGYINSGLINFQKLRSVRTKDITCNFERISSINNNFTKDIIARFSYYYSRQGSPDFNIDEIYDSLIK